MTQQPNSSPTGESSGDGIVIPQALLSTNVESPSILGMSDSTALPSPSFQPTENSVAAEDPPELTNSRLAQAFAAKLGKLVFWRRITLGDGQEVYALCFPVSKWTVDPVRNELQPR